MFSTLSKDAGSVVSSLVKGPAGKVLGNITTGLVSSQLGVKSPTSSNRLSNDLQSFLGHSSGITAALGAVDLTSYFLINPNHTLVNENNVPVSTNNSGIDATLANAILTIMNLAGCGTSSTNYNSANEQSSLFNLSLSLAANGGMSSEVNHLLGCSHTTTSLGQQSLTKAFTSSSNTQLGIASTILGSIFTPTKLNTPYVAKNILTNPTLKSGDKALVETMFQTLGTTLDKALNVSKASNMTYPVYDVTLLSSIQPSFIDTVFQDTSMTDYLSGSEMTMTQQGGLSYIY